MEAGEDKEDIDTEYSGLQRRELPKGEREGEYVGLRGWEGGLGGWEGGLGRLDGGLKGLDGGLVGWDGGLVGLDKGLVGWDGLGGGMEYVAIDEAH